jgi:hypothetical protein
MLLDLAARIVRQRPPSSAKTTCHIIHHRSLVVARIVAPSTGTNASCIRIDAAICGAGLRRHNSVPEMQVMEVSAFATLSPR